MPYGFQQKKYGEGGLFGGIGPSQLPQPDPYQGVKLQLPTEPQSVKQMEQQYAQPQPIAPSEPSMMQSLGNSLYKGGVSTALDFSDNMRAGADFMLPGSGKLMERGMASFYSPEQQTQARENVAPKSGMDWVANVGAGMLDPTPGIPMPNLGKTAMKSDVTTFGVGPSDIAKRKEFTKAVTLQLHEYIRDNNIPMDQAIQMYDVAAKYPRIMAHQLIQTLPDVEKYAATPGRNTSQTQAGRSLLGLNPRQYKEDSAGTFIHELTHGAQRISLKDKLDPAYSAADKKLGDAAEAHGFDRFLGYLANPFEQAARWSAKRRTGTDFFKMLGWPETRKMKRSTLQELKGMGITVPGYNDQ